MTKSHNALEKALRVDEVDLPCSNLFRIANAVCGLKKSKETFEDYIVNIDDPRLAMAYFFNCFFLYNLSYYRDHKNTDKSLRQRIDNIRNLGSAMYKLEDVLERKDSNFNSCVEKIRKIHNMMILEAEALLLEELACWNLAEYLKGIKEENKVEYIKTALSIPHGKGHPNLPQEILGYVSDASLQAIVA